MAKRKVLSKKPRGGESDRRKQQDRQESPPAEPVRRHVPSSAAIRETIESVVVAFVLAFLFRTFEAEAFVIPTGSMAPTLMGRHKDVVCPICGCPYRVSASDEVDSNSGVSRGPGALVEGCTCPMCHFTMDLGPDNPRHESYPSFKGDRILVGKFSYQFGEPQRWDVAVFKYPGGAKTNFIKRLVGLPGETIRIHHGDILVDKSGDGNFHIARKPLRKLLAMLQPVFDNDLMPGILEHGWPPRWGPADGSSTGAWKTDDQTSFAAAGAADGTTWLRYQHLVPSGQQWQEHLRGDPPSNDPLMPQLISDFCAYNTGRSANSFAPDTDAFGLHWVGDLALKCTLEVRSDSGRAIFELVEGGHQFQCSIDVATGVATLSISGLAPFGPIAQTDVRGRGKYEILFANCDDQLRLWVDGSVIEFDTATSYPPLGNTKPTVADLAPVGIGSESAALKVSHLEVLRDIYYITEGHRRYGINGPITDFKQLRFPNHVLSDPSQWDAFDNMKDPVDFVLEEDQFLALGDNSAKSKDGRLWEQEGFPYYVKRDLLIGKALYIYWPHSWNKLPGTNVPFPFFPNFPRMRFVR